MRPAATGLSKRSQAAQERRSAAPGDPAAFTALYERHGPELYRYCRSILRHEEDAHDALQSTMAKAFAALQSEHVRELRPWLFRIAHNESISLIRRRPQTDELDERAVGAHDTVHETVEIRERLTQLRQDLQDLPERQRGALVMRELSGLGHEEIAVALGTTPRAVKQVIYEARSGLGEAADGRAMRCESVQRTLSDADGRTVGTRRMRAHLRSCGSCRAFKAALTQRPGDLAALSPAVSLSSLASASALANLLGVGGATIGGTAATGGGAAAVGGGAAAVGGITAAAGGGAASAGIGTSLLGAGSAKIAVIAATAVAGVGGAVAVERTVVDRADPPTTSGRAAPADAAGPAVRGGAPLLAPRAPLSIATPIAVTAGAATTARPTGQRGRDGREPARGSADARAERRRNRAAARRRADDRRDRAAPTGGRGAGGTPTAAATKPHGENRRPTPEQRSARSGAAPAKVPRPSADTNGAQPQTTRPAPADRRGDRSDSAPPSRPGARDRGGSGSSSAASARPPGKPTSEGAQKAGKGPKGG